MSSDQARSYHSLTFLDGFENVVDEDNPGYSELIYLDAQNTWDDWHLIPATRPEFAAPKGKNKFVTIPGRSYSSVDISEAVVPYPLYGYREGTLSFYVDNDHEPWVSLYRRIADYLHGAKRLVILDDQPDFYYEGRFQVEWKNTKDYSTVDIHYKLLPYKHDVLSSCDDWLWDPFDFENGVINRVNEITLSSDHWVGVTLIGRQERTCPTIVCSGEAHVVFDGYDYSLKQGLNRNPLILLQPGENELGFRGTGTVSIMYRGGML